MFQMVIYFILFALSSADNANNGTMSVSSNSSIVVSVPVNYCNSQMLLYNRVLSCRDIDYCCKINIYENQFNVEQNKCNPPSNKTSLCDNLNKCRISCRNNVPVSYSCISGNVKEQYAYTLNTCYGSCFDNEYKCPNSKISQSKVFGIAETIIVVIVLGSFAICLARYTCFKDCICNFKDRRRSFSSKVHVAKTSNDFSDV